MKLIKHYLNRHYDQKVEIRNIDKPTLENEDSNIQSNTCLRLPTTANSFNPLRQNLLQLDILSLQFDYLHRELSNVIHKKI